MQATPRQNDLLSRSTGFSLIELIVVLLLLAVLSAGVAMSFSSAVRTARLDGLQTRLADYDRRCRDQAIRFGRSVTWTLRLSDGTATRQDEKEGLPVITQITQESGERIERILLAGGREASGPVTIACSPLGHSSSYAVQLRDQAGATRWLLVSGLTGTVTQSIDEDSARQLLSLTANPEPAARPHAD